MNYNKDVTIKELANGLGVTKQAIQYHIKKIPDDFWYFATKNGSKVIMINPEGQRVLTNEVTKRPTKRT